MLDEIVSLMLETVCTRRKVIRIAGDDYPAELVKSKFMKLNSSHIQFVIDCMHQNTTKIRNIKKYLLAVLLTHQTPLTAIIPPLSLTIWQAAHFYHRKVRTTPYEAGSIDF